MTGAKGAFPDIRVMHKGKIAIQDTRLNIENAARKKKKKTEKHNHRFREAERGTHCGEQCEYR